MARALRPRTARAPAASGARRSVARRAAEPGAVAAVDLGSNSFHMVVARSSGHDLHIVDRLKEPVCLAEGLDRRLRIKPEARARALACLDRFGQILRGLAGERVRAVGTNTLRLARDAGEFRSEARRALGHPIEVISGLEEARLIYLGVAHSHAAGSARRLVVDVGGGSTEVIVGEGFEPLVSHSLFMGCVGYTKNYFRKGAITRERFRRAETAALLELRTLRSNVRALGWDVCAGASGTVLAVQDLVRSCGFGRNGITLASLKKLRKALLAAGSVDRMDLPGLKPERARVLPGGLAILLAIFRSLGVNSMSAAQGALREGVLYDLAGRIRDEDVRDRTIRRLVEQYRVDVAQAARVERTAVELLRQAGKRWGVSAPREGKALAWAARLHEIGLVVSYSGYHKHGAYLVKNSDMPGFSSDDQELLAALIRGHRRRLSKAALADAPVLTDERMLRLCLLLRLAILLNRGRTADAAPPVRLDVDGKSILLGFPRGWLRDHALTRADLVEEARLLRGVKISVKIVD